MQRRATLKSRAANAAERRWISWVKRQDCSYCGAPGPCRYDHCAGSSAKCKVDFETVMIGHWFGLSECQICSDMSHKDKYEIYGPHHELWSILSRKYWDEVIFSSEKYDDAIPLKVACGIKQYSIKYGR